MGALLDFLHDKSRLRALQAIVFSIWTDEGADVNQKGQPDVDQKGQLARKDNETVKKQS